MFSLSLLSQSSYKQTDGKLKQNYIISLLYLSRLKCVCIAWMPK